MQTSGLTATDDNVVSEVALAQSALLTQHCSGRPQSPGVVNCLHIAEQRDYALAIWL